MQKVIYEVNGVASNIWRRMAASKTFWLIAVYVLYRAEAWNAGEIALSELINACFVGAIGILIRSGLVKAELAAQAANPDVEHVEAVTVESRNGAGKAMLFAGLLLTGSLFATGCERSGMAVSGQMCYTDPATGAQVCVAPAVPTPTPPPVAVAQTLEK